MSMVIPGMDMGAMGMGAASQGATTAEPAAPAGLPPCRGGLRGLAERAAGRCQ